MRAVRRGIGLKLTSAAVGSIAVGFGLALSFAACGGSDGSGDQPPGPDGAAGEDGSGDAAGEDAPEPEPAAPVAPETPPEPLAVETWMVASYQSFSEAAALEAAFADGTLEVPVPGSSYGAFWLEAKVGEDGAVPLPGPGGIGYAVREIEVAEDTGVLVRADRVLRVHANGAEQPGDPYGSARHRVPLRLEKGKNLVLWNAFRQNEAPRLQMWTTPDEVAFVPTDVTSPTLVAGVTVEAPMGLPVVNLGVEPVLGAVARVVASEHFEATELPLAPLAPGASTQAPFLLRPTAAISDAVAAAEEGTTPEVAVRLHLEAPALAFAYEIEVKLPVRGPKAGETEKHTFLSKIDGSAQFYGVRPPKEVVAGKAYALALSLHGAGVGADGQAAAYGATDFAYVVAPTNRRGFGFDWEAFGRLDGLEVLEDAMARFEIDPTRVYVTGHSMGGHGTWQFGTLFPGRFAVVGPSAGWISFATYGQGGGDPFPTGPFGWASLSSDTIRYVQNLARRAVYVIHGTADDNVPIGQAETMLAALEPLVPDLQHHFEPGAGHWWDNDPEEDGADCVDWPPLFETMKERLLDPTELDFVFISPSPAVSPRHSYVTLRSSETPAEVLVLTSTANGATVTLQTQNVRSLVLDGAALEAKGVTEVVVDGTPVAVAAGPLEVGPQDGKNPAQHGPFVQSLHRPFCLVYPDAGEGPGAWRHYAALLVSSWNVIGNGTACALPLSALTEDLRAARNLVFLGLPPEVAGVPQSIPITWDEAEVKVSGASYPDALVAFLWPRDDRLDAVIATTAGSEDLASVIQPFSSRFWIPDWLVYQKGGTAAAGFFDAEWSYEPSLSIPP